MKIVRLTLAGLCGLAIACGGDSTSDSGSGDVPEVDVPTEEEAAADAEASITEENADAELDKLAAEIEADDSDG